LSGAAEAIKLMETLNADHPFMPLIHADRVNPRFALLSQYISLIRADNIRAQGKCPWCINDASLTSDVREKNHKDHLAQHMLQCDLKHHPGFTRCPVCGVFLDGPWDDSDVEDHLEACVRAMLVSHGHLPPTDEDRRLASQPDIDPQDHTVGFRDDSGNPDEHPLVLINDPEDQLLARRTGQTLPQREVVTAGGSPVSSQPPVSITPTRGFEALSSFIRHSVAIRGCLIYFCPLCLNKKGLAWLYDPAEHGTSKRAPPEHRLVYFKDKQRMHQHIYAHFSGAPSRAGQTQLVYSRTFRCAFPPCDGEIERNLGATIEHLHNVHKYPLLKRNGPTVGETQGADDDDDNTDKSDDDGDNGDNPPDDADEEELELPPQFRFDEDVAHEATYDPAILAEHPVTLVDKRHVNIKRKSKAAIDARCKLASE